MSNSSKLMIRDISRVKGNSETALPAIANRHLYKFYLQKLKKDSLKLSKGHFDAFAKLNLTAKIKLCLWEKHLTCSQVIFAESQRLNCLRYIPKLADEHDNIC